MQSLLPRMSFQRDSSKAEGIVSSITNFDQSSLLRCLEKLWTPILLVGAPKDCKREVLKEMRSATLGTLWSLLFSSPPKTER